MRRMIGLRLHRRVSPLPMQTGTPWASSARTSTLVVPSRLSKLVTTVPRTQTPLNSMPEQPEQLRAMDFNSAVLCLNATGRALNPGSSSFTVWIISGYVGERGNRHG